MKNRNVIPKELYTVIISAMFLSGFLLLVVFGAKTYQKTVYLQQENQNGRALCGYLNTSLKTDRTAGVILDKSRHILWIQDSDMPEYGRCIYLDNGRIMEEYIRLDAEPFIDTATYIADSSRFDLLYHAEKKLLQIETSEGSVWIYMGMREVKTDE